jgi:hypothetical protein
VLGADEAAAIGHIEFRSGHPLAVAIARSRRKGA